MMTTIPLIALSAGAVAASSWRLAQARKLIVGIWETPTFRLMLSSSSWNIYMFPAVVTIAEGFIEYERELSPIAIRGTVSISDPRVIYNAQVVTTFALKYHSIIIGRDDKDVMEWIGSEDQMNWVRA